MARIQAKEWTEQFVRQGTQKAVQAAFVDYAKTKHAVIMRQQPRPNQFKRWVDNVEGAKEESVRYNGVIKYQYFRFDAIVQYAMEVLFEKSPVGVTDERPGHPGFYRDHHQLFLNGVAVSNLKGWKPGDEITIVNAVPYARVIELGGYAGNPSWKVRVPGTDHVYFQAEQIVKKRYGNLANIRFSYRGVGGIGLIGGRQGNVSDNRYPALVISER